MHNRIMSSTITEEDLNNFPELESPVVCYWENPQRARNHGRNGMIIDFDMSASLLPSYFTSSYTQAYYQQHFESQPRLTFENFVSNAAHDSGRRSYSADSDLYLSPPIQPSSKTTASDIPKLKINGTQKNLIEGTFFYIFDAITALESANALKALKGITAVDLFSAEIVEFQKNNIWDVIAQARKIFFNDRPEELLNLKSRNGENTLIEKTAVTDYITDLIDQEKQKILLNNHAAKLIQFWYRESRDKDKTKNNVVDVESKKTVSLKNG